MCYCARIQIVQNRWPVHILQTAKESAHPLNTAIMAKLSLQKATINRLETNHSPQQIVDPLKAAQGILVFPADNAQPITEIVGEEPRPLIFIDSTWRKAKRMLHESPQLRELPVVFLAARERRYSLRSARSHERVFNGQRSLPLSTIEAIAAALGYFERDEEKYLPLLELLESVQDDQRTFMPDRSK